MAGFAICIAEFIPEAIPNKSNWQTGIVWAKNLFIYSFSKRCAPKTYKFHLENWLNFFVTRNQITHIRTNRKYASCYLKPLHLHFLAGSNYTRATTDYYYIGSITVWHMECCSALYLYTNLFCDLFSFISLDCNSSASMQMSYTHKHKHPHMHTTSTHSKLDNANRNKIEKSSRCE